MTDTNGAVAPEHLTTRFRVPVSKAIAAKLDATSVAFHRAGYTFTIALPAGGYRSISVQEDMHAHPRNYNLTPSPPAPPLAPIGHSRHGFGLAVDVITNASPSRRDALMSARGWTKWATSDPNHFEPTGVNVLVSPPESAFAGLDSSPLNDVLLRRRKGDTMYTHFRDDPAIASSRVPVVYAVFTDANGQPRLRVAGVNEAAIAYAGGESIAADGGTINGLGAETGYNPTAPHAVVTPTVTATVDASSIHIPPVDFTPVLQELAAINAKVSAIKVPTKGTVELA